jgi:alpha-amylase/alpha-mannosidase (GH57 family)
VISLAFLWHQHQPYYPDDLTGENPMPWVRLHGVKDYYGMALHLQEFPEMRCTINLVPSLLVQLQAYVERGATDRFLQVSRIPADSLSESDAQFVLDHFFMANHEHMIRPFPRYGELLQRRGFSRHSARDVLRRFPERDLRDLQVWFNLAWIHPLAVAQDAALSELVARGRNFTEQDRELVLGKHLEILGRIIPLHRQLMESGQVELTTTPFYHPILPLLLDKKHAREAMPDVKLPRYTGGYPEDAAVHVQRAVQFHEHTFGRPPKGMWPAEGSVCQAMLPLLGAHGVRWIATDEEVLAASTQGFVGRDHRGHVRNPEHLYRPYRVAEGGHELGIVFRDHALSDMIGFHYQRSDPVAAAEDFIGHLRRIDQAIGGRNGAAPALVSVILDGENCWEHYPGGGVPFLRALYERCCKAPDIRPVSVGAYLEQHPPRDTLPRLFAGSWIHHNFAIWIGHEEDNTAWDALHKAREHLLKRSTEFEVRSAEFSGNSALERAWQEIYIAESSDWYWWFGDDHSSLQDVLFDYLFRKHLMNVYQLLGDAPPPELARSICRRTQRAIHSLPTAFLAVRVDGRARFFEWINAGHYTCQNERGTMAMAGQGPLKDVYFGFDRQALLLRVDFEDAAHEALSEYDALRVGFLEPPGYEVLIRPGRERKSPAVELRRDEQPIDAAGVAVGIDHIVELAVPFARLGLKVDEPIQFVVELLESQQSRDRAPREGTIHLTCPSPDFERIMWDV